MKIGGFALFFNRLFLLSAISLTVVLCSVNTTASVNTTDAGEFLVVESCTCNITNFEKAQRQFYEYANLKEARFVDFKLSGIVWADSSNETIEVFDPNWWSWATRSGEYLTLMPIDFKILSFGLSWFAIKEMELHFTGSLPGCLCNYLTFEQQRRMVMNEILRLTVNDHGGDDLICQSTYSRKSPFTGNLVVVGKTCTLRSRLRPETGDGSNLEQTATGYKAERFVNQSVEMGLVMMLSLFVIAGALYLLRHRILRYMYIQNDRTQNGQSVKSEPSQLFRLSHIANRRNEAEAQPSGSGEDEGEITQPGNIRISVDTQAPPSATLPLGVEGDVLLMRENELTSFEGPVPLLDLLDLNTCKLSFGVQALKLLWPLQLTLVIAWLYLYSYMGEAMQRLDSVDKIVSNFCNPYSWCLTDKSFWPKTVCAFITSMNGFLTIPSLLLGLRYAKRYCVCCVPLSCLSFNKKLFITFNRQLHRMKWSCFYVIFVPGIISSFISVYAIIKSMIYVIGALIAGIDIVFPWLAGGLLSVYYIQRSYLEVIETYTDIKREVLKACYSEHTSCATYEASVSVKRVTSVKCVFDGCNDLLVYTALDKIVLQEPVVFVCNPFRRSHGDQSDNSVILNKHQHFVSKKTLLCIYKRIAPISANILKALVKLMFTLIVLGVVAIFMTIFNSNPSTGIARFVVTSFPALFTAFLRWLFESMTTDAEKKIRKDNVAIKARELLPELPNAEFTRVADVKDDYTILWSRTRNTLPCSKLISIICRKCVTVSSLKLCMVIGISFLASLVIIILVYRYLASF